MVKIDKVKINDIEYTRIRDTSYERPIQYYFKLEKFSAKQWLAAHNAIMSNLEPSKRTKLTNKQIKQLAFDWLNSPKDLKADVKKSGINLKLMPIVSDTEKETEFVVVMTEYLTEFRKGETSSTITKAKRQCDVITRFLQVNGINLYSQLDRKILTDYPIWRKSVRLDGRNVETSADTINKELYRFARIIQHGIQYYKWQEKFLLKGIRAKITLENTKAIKPFEIAEVKTIMKWLRNYSVAIDSWHLHDMILLALCSGMEAKALDKMQQDWWLLELGILRVFEKLVSGVIDAKTQQRNRDIPLTQTMRKIYERKHIFQRDTRTHRTSQKGNTTFAAWAESQLRKCERETGIADVNLHRFRHTCATAHLSSGWSIVRISKMLGHKGIVTTLKHYADYDFSASPEGFEGMIAVYKEFCEWLDVKYF